MTLKFTNWQRALAIGVAFGLIVAAGVAQVYQVQTTVTDANGNRLATASTQFSVGAGAQNPTTTASPVVTPPSMSQPTSQPTAANMPSIPGVAGMTYGTDTWRGTFAYDSDGFPQPPVPAPAATSVWLSSSGCGWSQTGDFTDLNSAKIAAFNKGSFVVYIRDGSVFTNNQLNWSPYNIAGTWNTNLDIPGGTQAHPVVITRWGRNGYGDHTLSPPVTYGQLTIGGHSFATASNGGLPAMNYVEIFGIDFYANARDPQASTFNSSYANSSLSTANGSVQYQQYAIAFVDNGNAQSDHFLVSACRFRDFMSPIAFQTSNAAPSYTLNSVWIDHCSFPSAWGSRFEIYTVGVKDCLRSFCVFGRSGWDFDVFPKDGSGMEHNIYDNSIVPASSGSVNMPSDPQHRDYDNIYSQPESQGIKQALGGLDDTDLFLACPIALFGIHWPTYVNNCAIDGDNAEFDPLTAANNGSSVQKGSAGLALSDGSAGTVGHQTGEERGWGINFVTQPNASVTNTLLIDKLDAINNGPAIQISTVDNNNTGTDPAVGGNFIFSNVIVHNWTQGAFNASSPGPNTPVITVTDNNGNTTAVGTVAYSGCIMPGFTGQAGVASVEPAYTDATRTVSTYAKSLGVSGVSDGPSFLNFAENSNWNPGTYDPRFSSAAAIAWIQAGFKH